MYLHENKEVFRDMIEQVSVKIGRTPIVVEKDYYVTMILNMLSEKLDHLYQRASVSLTGFQKI